MSAQGTEGTAPPPRRLKIDPRLAQICAELGPFWNPSGDRRVGDDTLRPIFDWMQEFAMRHDLTLDRHYGVWSFRWTEKGGVERQIQLDSNDKPRIRFDVHSSAWIDNEETLTRRGSSHRRHYYLYHPFSHEVFLDTLELAHKDVRSLDPIETPDSVSELSPPWGYGRPKPANWPD